MFSSITNIKMLSKHIYTIAISFIAVLLAITLWVSFYIGNRLINIYVPTIDAAMELRHEVNIGHLWLEEIISGSKSNDIRDVLSRFENAKCYIDAMQNDGDNKDSTFLKISDPKIIGDLKKMDSQINNLIQYTKSRDNLIEKGKAGTEIDPRYNKVYNQFINESFLFENHIMDLIHKDSDKFKLVQKILSGFVFVILLFVWFIFNRYEKKRSQRITEYKAVRKQLEESKSKLTESLQKLSLHIEQTPLAVIEWDLDFNVTKWNKAAEKIFGYTEKEAVGNQAADLIVPKEVREEINQVWNSLLEKRGGSRNVNKNKRKDGRIIYCEWYNTPLVTTKGKIIGVASLAHDITEQKLAEEALRSIAYKFANVSGKSYFENVCRHISVTLQIDYAFVGMLAENNTKVLVKAGIGKGLPIKEFEYNLVNTPCENVIDKSICCYPNGVQSLFPKDHMLVEMGVESYTGMSLYSTDGKTLGIIVLLDSKPIVNQNVYTSLLQIFSNRVSVEIERCITMEKLLESEERFKSLMQQSPYGIAIYDSYGLQLSVNKAYEELWNLPAETTANKFNILKSKEAQRTGLIKYVKRAYAGETVTVPEYALGPAGDSKEKGSGLVRWLSSRIYPLTESSGNVKNIVIIHQDITEKKEKENEIIKLTKAMEQTPTTIVITDLDGNIEYVNKRFEDSTGYDKDEALGQNPRILKSGNISKEIYSELWNKISSGETWHGELQNKKKNGELYWEDVIISPVKDDNDQIINYLAIKTDITEIKTLQKKLEEYNYELEERVKRRTKEIAESEENYRTLAETMEEYICRLDSNQNIIFMNSSLLKEMKKDLKDVIGKKLNTLLKLFSNSNKIEIVKKKIQKKKSTKLIDKVPWGKWIEWQIIFKEDTNNHSDIIVVGHDITKGKQLELKMKESLTKEKELNILKTQFISTVSHEFRTPLTSIYSSIELIERYGEKWEKEKKQGHFTRIKTSIDHLIDMLEEILQLSRTETGKIEFRPEVVDFHKFCDSVIKDSMPLLSKEHSLNYNYNLSGKYYFLDQSLLRIILTNLISNAIKYSPDGGDIDIDVRSIGDNIQLTVKDNGMGISKKDIKNIFVPFYRSDETSTITGSGLGLSITKKYTELHKGTLKVESELGKGSLFILQFPLLTNGDS